jgi:hypothetical protein
MRAHNTKDREYNSTDSYRLTYLLWVALPVHYSSDSIALRVTKAVLLEVGLLLLLLKPTLLLLLLLIVVAVVVVIILVIIVV